MGWTVAAAAGLVLALGSAAPADRALDPAPAPARMTPRDILALPFRPADQRIGYGPASSQFADLRLPEGRGPHPVVVLVHGGCWSMPAGADFFGAMADALKAAGIASWNIEYRRLPEPGSGWPGTYADVAQAIDHLRAVAPRYNLDLTRVVFVGHSAGGHLAHWAAGRTRVPKDSILHTSDPLIPRGVINLAGRVDMAEGIDDYEKLCRGPVVRNLLGGLPAVVPDRYAVVSPRRLLPLGVPQILIWGEYEEFVPTPLAQDFVAAANRAGDDAQLVRVPGIGHFETASPASAAWPQVLLAIRTLLGVEPNR